MECIIIGGWFLCALLGGLVLSAKGGAGLGGFALGLFLGPIGIIIAALWPVSPKVLEEKSLQVGEMMKCPHCAELIRAEANVCRYCQRELTPSDFVKQAAAAVDQGRKSEARQLLLYAIQRENRNEEAWLRLSTVASGEQEYEKCLRSVLAINPDSAEAREQLEDLGQRRAARSKAARREAIILWGVLGAIVAALLLVAGVIALWTYLTGYGTSVTPQSPAVSMAPSPTPNGKVIGPLYAPDAKPTEVGSPSQAKPTATLVIVIPTPTTGPPTLTSPPTATSPPPPSPTPTQAPLGTRANPIPRGQNGLTPDGWQIVVVDFNPDAWPVVLAENQFNDPPRAGNRMVIVRVGVTNVSVDPQFAIAAEASFSLEGSRNVVYTTFDAASRCGVIPDQLLDEVLTGENAEGNACFQIPADETGLLLIYNAILYPYVYFAVQ